VDYRPEADVVGDYMQYAFPSQESIWCSHVLEHQRNPGLFLDKIFEELQENGLLAITVPPARSRLAGGHVTIWNLTVLLYQLVLAGFDCSEAVVLEYGYNISCVLRKKSRPVLQGLVFDKGDEKIINRFFPQEVQ
jgi:hypothetical protein